MVKKYGPLLFLIVFYTAVVTGLIMFLVFIYSLIMGFQTSDYLRALSNILFFAGALVFTFGAFVEFFVRARSPSILRSMMLPFEVFTKSRALEEKDMDAARTDEDGAGGWALIAIGALTVIISLAFAYTSMK